MTNSNMATRINEFNSKKAFELCANRKYLSMETLTELKLANLLASIQREPIVKGISEQT